MQHVVSISPLNLLSQTAVELCKGIMTKNLFLMRLLSLSLLGLSLADGYCNDSTDNNTKED